MAGERIVSGKCLFCPVGSYSLAVGTECTECQSLGSVRRCEGKDIDLKAGYWRRHPQSHAILPCPGELNGCAGGTNTGDASCALGYEGPLCSVCSEGYFLSGRVCQACSNTKKMPPAAVLFIIVGSVLLAAALVVLLYHANRAITANIAIIIQHMYNTVLWMEAELKDVGSEVKIVITTLQICSVMPVSMNVAFPASFARYLSAVSALNLNVMSVVPINCGSGSYNFIDKLVMMTLAPIGFSLLLLIGCMVECARHAIRVSFLSAESEEDAVTRIKSRYLTLFFLLTYLVLPNVATTIFRTFLCTDVGPKDATTDVNDRYLTADMRISCDSDYYQRGVIYASFMIVVYVVGIPLMYAVLLYRSRKDIAGRYGKEIELVDGLSSKSLSAKARYALTGSGKRKNPLALRHDPAAHQAQMVSFLWISYKPEFWYWEIVETTRRLLLTAVLSVCGPGTAAQAILALLLALFYIKLYGFFRPYEAEVDSLAAEVGQFQIFLTFLGALIIQRQLLGAEWNTAVGAALLVINVSVTMLFLGQVAVRLIRDARRSSQPSIAPGEVNEPGLDELALPEGASWKAEAGGVAEARAGAGDDDVAAPHKSGYAVDERMECAEGQREGMKLVESRHEVDDSAPV